LIASSTLTRCFWLPTPSVFSRSNAWTPVRAAHGAVAAVEMRREADSALAAAALTTDAPALLASKHGGL
jgi:hypothetical protein